jgi:MFS family permease
MVTGRDVHVRDAWTTPQFVLLWVVLCANVSAGIGVLEQASPMIQEVFKGRVTASAAAGFVGLLSLFNIAGRIAWASLSDRIGRRATYFIFFALGILLYASVPYAGRSGSVALFVGIFCLILTMYGGGFATIPAYLADMFGTRFVGAIHGRLLTAWSTAGVVGPLLVNSIRQRQVDAGVPPAAAYNTTMYILAGLLVAGLVCNWLMRPVSESRFMRDAGPANAAAVARDASPSDEARRSGDASPAAVHARPWLTVAAAWTLVGVPLLWGVLQTIGKAALLFQ